MTAFRQKIVQQFHIPIIARSTIIFSIALLRQNIDFYDKPVVTGYPPFFHEC
ncbi:MAG: hypothetical protein A4E62_03172 [Syntrophorhabdus sp. PtaU1.Bin002]|nr:MAG: hypothetical protein A4E62_03172 [Syntrophorhabdus sp. PtaU1.Bin002]